MGRPTHHTHIKQRHTHAHSAARTHTRSSAAYLLANARARRRRGLAPPPVPDPLRWRPPPAAAPSSSDGVPPVPTSPPAMELQSPLRDGPLQWRSASGGSIPYGDGAPPVAAPSPTSAIGGVAAMVRNLSLPLSPILFLSDLLCLSPSISRGLVRSLEPGAVATVTRLLQEEWPARLQSPATQPHGWALVQWRYSIGRFL